ncbi:PspC domain-containing protein [Streptococcus sp. zg-JUN1979]|uniref:PspC domain-containing protein n=1 Tax=Streptococcus sp. zg-JUN1979 TaxID=3391450 RepID=UPI0039A401A5
MKSRFYKQRQNKCLAGVIAGLADKFGWDLGLARVIAALLIFVSRYGLILYILLAIFLPYKEDIEYEQYGQGPRKRKDAEVVNDDDGWFW